MDVQMTIPILTVDTPVQGHTVPVVVSRTNVSPLSHAALRDPNILKDLQPFATRYDVNLYGTFPTRTHLYFLLLYQTASEPKEASATHDKTAIKILETAWNVDIRCWLQNRRGCLEQLFGPFPQTDLTALAH